jgi:uncharacterized membrane protein
MNSTMNNNMSSLLVLLVVALATTTVTSFTTTVTPMTTSKPCHTKIISSPFLSSTSTTTQYNNHHATNHLRKANLIRAISATTTSAAAVSTNDGENKVTEKIIQQLEREEAKMNKKAELARERLNKVEQTLNQLQTKKSEYLMGSKLASTPEGGNFSETTARSAVKALMWRVIAGSVTFITSLRFSGSMKTALTIVGSDFLSKSFTMFIGERLMNKSQAGRESGADGAGRSLMKALVWRLFAICNTLTMAIFIAKDITMASKIAGSDAIFKTGLMFVYERVWAKIEWGKEYQVDFFI